jgi:hypothetical protein
MDELVGRLVANLGVDRATAETAVGIIFNLLASEGPADKMVPFIAKLPGAEALMQKVARADSGADAGDFMAGAAGVMGAGMRMMAAGLSMEQVQSVSREVMAYAREKVGADAVSATVAAIPGLAQFV